MRHTLSVKLLTGLLAVSTPALAQTSTSGDAKPAENAPSLPDAQSIVDRMIEFQGGRKAFTDLPPLTAVGTFGVPAMNISGVMKTWTAPPNLMKVEMDMPALGKSLTGFNGTVGWSIDPTRGPSLMTGGMLAEIRREANRMSDLDLFKEYDSVQVIGRENFKGADCVVLELKEGKTVNTRLIEEATGRPVANRTVMPTPMGEIPATTVFEAWTTVGPLKIPSRTTVEVMGMQQIITIDKVTPGPIEASVFELPPAIQALVRQNETKTATDGKAASDGETSSSKSSDSSSSSSSDSSSSRSSDSSSSRKSSSSKSSDSSGSKKSSRSGSSSSSSSGGRR